MKKKGTLKKAAIWFAAFIVFTVLVMFVDVQPAGHPEGLDASVGLASINIPVFEALFGLMGSKGASFFYKVSQFCGIIAVAVCICMFLSGCSQLFRRKSLHFVNPKIIAMGFFYATVFIVYAAFDFIAINYRPVLIGSAELDPSYPSSHTILALTFLVSLIFFAENFRYEEPKARILYQVATRIVIVITVLSRVLSCTHWITDIIGGLLMSMALINLYHPYEDAITGLHDKNEQKRLNKEVQ